MRNLLNFLTRYSNLIIFLILEAVSVWLLVEAGGYHSSRFLGGVRNVSVYFERKLGNILDYIHLKQENLALAEENLHLKRQLERYAGQKEYEAIPFTDDSDSILYYYFQARVVNNTVNRQRNFFTLAIGSIDGVRPEMAVAGPDGVAGIIISVSDHFSQAMSVLNLDFRLSVRLRGSGYFGSLRWDGHDVTRVLLNEIPYHVKVSIGDTVETSGYSAIFPPGILVGTVSGIDEGRGDFYIISVDLSTDFRKLGYLYIIGYTRKEEQQNIEKMEGGVYK